MWIGGKFREEGVEDRWVRFGEEGWWRRDMIRMEEGCPGP